MLNKKVLLVDDEEKLLSSIKRNLRNYVDLHTINEPGKVLEYMKKHGPFAVIISDYQMPKINGITLLQMVQKSYPDTVRLMLTGQADLTVSIESINRGKIFRFLTKPCGVDDLKIQIKDAVRQHELIVAEKELLRDTLRGSINVITDILTMVAPDVFGKSNQAREYIKDLHDEMAFEAYWQVDLAVTLYLIGFILIPDSIITKVTSAEMLSPDEVEMYNNFPEISAKIINNIPRLGKVAEIIENITYENITPETPLPSKAIRAVNDFLDISKRTSKLDAIHYMARMANIYDPEIVSHLENIIKNKGEFKLRELYVKDLKEGMILDEDITTIDGLLLIKKDHTLNDSSIQRLNNYGKACGIKEPIKILLRVKKQS